MSVTTGSLTSMSRLPIRAFMDLDRVNFFPAAMLAGFGPLHRRLSR